MRLGFIGAAVLLVGGCTFSSHPEPGPFPPDRPDEPFPPDRPDEPFPPPPMRPPTDGPAPSTEALPPTTGGTMTLTADGRVVVVDPQAGLLALVNVDSMAVEASADLEALDDPGRVVTDAAGRIHVVLRRSGELLTLGADLEVQARRDVCEAPRGVVHDSESDQLHVACASGELVSLPAAGGAATRTLFVEPDLRDVVLGPDGTLFVSVFRSAELLTLDANGTVVERRRPPTVTQPVGSMGESGSFVPNVAYRIRSAPGGQVVMVHQRSLSTPIDVDVDGYGGGMCRTGVVESAFTLFRPTDLPLSSGALVMTTLAVDIALDPGGETVEVVSGANDQQALFPTNGPRRLPVSRSWEDDPCAFPDMVDERFDGGGGSTVAVEVLSDGRVITQRTGADHLIEVWTGGVSQGVVAHPRPTGIPHGSAVFHATTPTMVACASCHPEGGEDGHTWDFVGTGPRRTQTLLGGLLDTAPFHWSGDQPSMDHIMSAAFVDRMGGTPREGDNEAISAWLDAQPIPEGPVDDAEAWARGQTLFGEACASCHAGDALTDNRSVDIGTGGAFQVPSLRGVLYRAPYLHDGCAPSLEAAVDGSCSPSSMHGDIGALAVTEVDDLVTYVRSL